MYLLSNILFTPLERYPSKPYIKEGYPGNITVLINETATLACPPVSDLEPHLYWLKVINATNDIEVGPSDAPIPDGIVIEVDSLFNIMVTVLFTDSYLPIS